MKTVLINVDGVVCEIITWLLHSDKLLYWIYVIFDKNLYSLKLPYKEEIGLWTLSSFKTKVLYIYIE